LEHISIKTVPIKDWPFVGEELLVKGEAVFIGYLSAGFLLPGLDEESWYHTSDIVALDQRGIFIFDRLRPEIVFKGHKIFPQVIEKKLVENIDGVKNAFAIQRGEESVIRIIVTHEGAEISKILVEDWCASNFP